MCHVCAFRDLCFNQSPVGCAFLELADLEHAEPPADNLSVEDHIVLTCEQPVFRHPAIEA